jgi:hypothetical protein
LASPPIALALVPMNEVQASPTTPNSTLPDSISLS